MVDKKDFFEITKVDGFVNKYHDACI